MNSKSLLIAIAAFAVTATGAQAFVGTNYLVQAGLSQSQVEAFTQARELRLKGKNEEARDRLLEAGLDEETLDSLRTALKAAHTALHDAIADNDFAAFKTAVEGTPLYDIITTEEDFKTFVAAHNLRATGSHREARELFTELGVSAPKHGLGHFLRRDNSLSQLTNEQKDALRAARQANDQETVVAILEEAGVSSLSRVDMRERHHQR